MGRRNRSLTSAVARAAAFHTTSHLAGGGGSRIIAWPVLVIATLIAYTWTTVAGGWTAIVVGAGLMWAWHRTAVVSQTGHGVGLVRSARSAPRTLLYAWAGTTALWLWQTALTPGGGPMGALLLLVLTILSCVLGRTAGRRIATQEAQLAGMIEQLAWALGVRPEQLLEGSRVRTTDDTLTVAPLPPQALGHVDQVRARLAEVAPDWQLKSLAPAGLVLRAATDAELENRAVVASTDGLVESIDGEVWHLRRGASDGDAKRISQLAREQGLRLISFDAEERVAVVRHLDAGTSQVRDQLADRLGLSPWDIELQAPADGRVEVLRLPGKGGTFTPATVADALDSLRPGAEHERWIARGSTVTRELDPLVTTTAYPEAPEVSMTSLPFAVSETGGTVSIGILERNLLLGGVPGGGKSGGLTALLAGLARLEHVALVGVDPKRVEQVDWKRRFSLVVTEQEEAAALLRELSAEMDRRYDALASTSRKKYRPSDFTTVVPLIVVVVDELADLVARGDKKVAAECAALIERLVAVGRAAGLVLVTATQKPGSETIPTRLRDLIQTRIAYATTTPAMTDTILGAGAAVLGADAHEISAQLRGVCYIKGETDRGATRCRTLWVEDERVPEIARETAHLRVELPWLEAAVPGGSEASATAPGTPSSGSATSTPREQEPPERPVFVASGSGVESTTTPSPKAASSGSTTTRRPSAARVREWARASGIEVSERGKLPQALYDAYAAAHS